MEYLKEDVAKVYAAEVLLALEELHKRDIVYRDLKPDNIVLDPKGHAMLTDFGLSKEGVKLNESTHSFCGSFAYLAPEMIRRSGHGKSIDWYLFGVLIYEMLMSVPPFYNRKKAQMHNDIMNSTVSFKTAIEGLVISDEIKDLLPKLLQKNPRKRIGSGAEDA